MRPAVMILAGLSIAGAAKIVISLAEGPVVNTATAPVDNMFIASAQAAGAAPKEEEKPTPVAAPEPMQCPETPEDMLRFIRQERELMTTQKTKLAQRASELDLASETVELEQGRLSDLKAELETLLQKVEQAHTTDVDRLVSLYQNMKPKDAANIMDDLDIEVTVMVMGTMDERSAAPILAALNPVRARAISQIILERSKLPGDQRLDDIKF